MMANSSNKPDTGTWNSIDEALETLYSFSRVTKGSGPKSGEFSKSNQSAERFDVENNPDSSQSHTRHESTSEEVMIDENSIYRGGGRGQFMKDLQKQISRQQLDETIHNELKQIFSSDFSNAAIESHFASTCSSSSESSTQETRVFNDPYSVNDPGNIDFVIGESNIMKKINSLEKGSRAMKKSPRCRNAIILNLTQKKNSEQDSTKKVPELKGPDVFLSSKSYSNVLASNTSNSNHDDGPILNEEDFPAL